VSRSIFSAPHFNDEAAAYAFVEARIWKDGRVCPHCGVIDHSGALKGKTDRIGSYKCYACRKKFSVKVGTIFEDSHVAMRDWLVAIHMLCSSKKGISSNQLSRTLGVTLKTAWFMSHRIREAMRTGSFEAMRTPMGGSGGIVEADETFIGRKEGSIKRRGHGHKNTVLSLVDRKSKKVRSFHVDGVSAATLVPIVIENVAEETAMMTDESGAYFTLGEYFASHESVNHKADEWVRDDVHTNTVEGYFSIFKRGMKGVCQHCSEKHLHRYVAEFDFRYNNRSAHGVNDDLRATRALQKIVGKRLTYRDPIGK
jgi:transposase-like protein